MQALRSSGGVPYQGKSALHAARDTFPHKSHRTWSLWHVQGWLQQDLVCLLCQQWRCRQVTCNDGRMSCHYALWMLCAPGGYPWWCQQDGTPKARPTTQLFVLRAGFLFWLDRIQLTMDALTNNAPGHAARDVRSENLPHCAPFAFEVFEGTAWWEGWCGKRRLRTLVIAAYWHLTSSGMSMCKEGSTDNFHDSSVFEKVDISSIEKQMSHFFPWQNHVLLLLLLLLLLFFFEIEILISIALFWWSGCWLEPLDLFNEEKKSFQSDAGRKEQADKRKAGQKATESKGKG